MARKFAHIGDEIRKFIEKQKMFFVGTAGAEGKVNISPKGMDTFRVLGENKVVWLNLTGSGNETAAHLLENGRITIMFCAFEGDPLILRLYGTGTALHPRDKQWSEYIGLFPQFVGARQIICIDVDLVQTSCGFAVPLYEFAGERQKLTQWAQSRGAEGIREYWGTNNTRSLDGKPTGILDD